jgi:S1-C subfamily serine protease
MAMSFEWRVPPEAEPRQEDYGYDLDQALSAVVGLTASVPSDAFTAEILGTERSGNGVIIRSDGLIVTIGYLITEAAEIWLTLADGRTVQGHALGYDQETGFGLVQALARLDAASLPFGDSGKTPTGTDVVAAGAGGTEHSVAAHLVARQEFAGYWEYVLDETLFTAPAHPYWGGTALIGPRGELLGIGSLQLQHAAQDGSHVPLNMYVPIDLLKPILDDMLTIGQPNRPPRPWLGVYATEVENRVVIAGIAGRGPAASADLRQGDIVESVAGAKVGDLAGMFRQIWSLGKAGVEVPFTVYRNGKSIDLNVISADRNRFLKGPSLH